MKNKATFLGELLGFTFLGSLLLSYFILQRMTGILINAILPDIVTQRKVTFLRFYNFINTKPTYLTYYAQK